MEVKVGVLKYRLSAYLRHVRETGEPVIVLDRDKPVAEIRPYQGMDEPRKPSVWELRERDEKTNGPWRDDFALPKRHTSKRKCKPAGLMAATHLLDTSVYSQVLRPRPVESCLQRWKSCGDNALAVSSICVAELAFGRESPWFPLPSCPQEIARPKPVL